MHPVLQLQLGRKLVGGDVVKFVFRGSLDFYHGEGFILSMYMDLEI